ncbi:MAG: hypothetical protein A2086_14765 [Spirochaetes bacterium GWD1_27_9]|nr:MAG: hypothetical protein A2Z98_04965 [Spirochaetes bacterium GWB1_27_13]OHD35921.1 MAG: hypothetical protein A2086_14765 [Spirochaetes bacterium GWD1_27_9]
MNKLLPCLCLIAFITLSACTKKGSLEMDKKYEFEYTNIENIEIKGAVFDIEIDGESRSNVFGTIETSDESHKLYHTQKGKTMEIWYKRPLWKLPFFRKHSLVLKVPYSTNIKIDNSSGKVNIKSIKTKKVEIKASSGNVLINNIEALVDVKTSSGSITASKLLSQNKVSFKTSSGSIKIEDIKADIKIDTTSGKQIYKNITGNINANASSGDIYIEFEKGVLELKTTSGKISGKDITITGNSFFKTTSGNISMAFKNSIENFTFNLRTNSGRLEVGDQRTKNELITGNGKIKIKGESSSGSQNYNTN